ncbi:MAG: heat shock protein HspQ [Alphaproteobacteria bacterium]|jgi:heat shock protein HspQ|nr:DNA-binding protein [Rhodospirillaceae bacterium]MDP6405048.1 heat shock protein HspQ [Alphaproteobacteria bacterium]MDP6623943.1 heat shock protein HspQ [Alphaproteobacteria bacterium]|tara:strand:- start:510 stop:827 length:318 start_codon:yes stop_codon:yes gene_type:complete
MNQGEARFQVGQTVQHKLFDYRGVVVDVDPVYSGSDEWYERMALSRPPKDAPWYHVLVDEAVHATYVAERNLQNDPSTEPIRHPLVDEYFSGLRDGLYLNRQKTN